MPSPPKSPTIGIRYISDAVKSDHRLLERLVAKLNPQSPTSTTPAKLKPQSPAKLTLQSPANTTATTTTSKPAKDQQHVALCVRLAWELARHLVAMELFIYPGTARRARQGNAAARERLRDMVQLREELRALSAATSQESGGPCRGEELSAALEELGSHLVGRHIRDVERVDLVNIEKVLSAQESEDMARDFERTVFFIPHGVRDDDEDDDFGVKAPYKSVEGLLDASPGELRAAMKKFPVHE